MTFKTLHDLPANTETVLLRADLNVPVHEGAVTDNTRLVRLVPTVRLLQQKGVKIVILSHFGRPKGRDLNESLRPIAKALGHVVGEEIAFADECIGDIAKNAVAALPKGKILVLENLRFHPEEEKNDPAFARALAALGDVYVNDAFSAAHRAHASIEALAHMLPCYAGELMREELQALAAALETPVKPVLALVGGSKVSTKIAVLENLVKRVDFLVLGGGMANTFLLAQGHGVGQSLCEPDQVATAQKIMQTAAAHKCEIVLPIDVICAKEFAAQVPTTICDVAAIQSDDRALDIGPRSVGQIEALLRKVKTVVWNGPVGAFETPPFAQATMALARLVAAFTAEKKLVSVAGGGDTVAALEMADVVDQMSYVSTAGGAFLEWLEGKELPGVKALENCAQ